MFGSYNKFDARVHVDAHIVSVVDFLTSLLASIVVFSTLGHSAHVLGVPVETVAKGGQGLAFVAYPEVSHHYSVQLYHSNVRLCLNFQPLSSGQSFSSQCYFFLAWIPSLPWWRRRPAPYLTPTHASGNHDS